MASDINPKHKIGWAYLLLLSIVLFIGGWIVFWITNCRGSAPTWSPDGKEIALTCSRGVDIDSADIYIANIDGVGQWRNLTNNKGQRYDAYPVWSPDGRQIAFDLDLDDLVVVNVDGSGTITNLTEELPLRTSNPVWSPNNRQIAFIASQESSNDWTSTLVYIMNVDGSGVKELANGPGYVGVPAWSPNGEQIAFLSFPADERDLLTIMDGNGNNKKILADNLKDAENVQWSPNGKFLSLTYLTGVDLISIDGNDRKNVLDLNRAQLGDWNKWGVFPYAFSAWSPDGQQIAVAYGGSHVAEITIVNIGDGEVKQIAQWPGKIISMSWSPDGQQLLIDSDSDCSSEICQGRAGIFIMNIDDAELRALKIPFPLPSIFLLILSVLMFVFGIRSRRQFVRRQPGATNSNHT